jgi:hypothetical protein
MRVIVSGGTGLIGRPLAASLAEDGHEVFVLSRKPDEVAGLPPTVRVEGWDGRTSQGWGRLVDGAGAVVNLAGETIAGESLQGILLKPWGSDRKRRILESRVHAGKAVTEAIEAAQRKPAVLIQASAVGYYGPLEDQENTEETPAGVDFLARTCVAWEASSQAVEGMGVRRAIIRSGLVLSGKGGVLPVMTLPFRLLLGGRLGSGRQWVPWIHLADEVRAIRFLLDTPGAAGPFNLVAPRPVTNAELSRVLGKVLGRPSFLPAPAFALRLVLGEKATLVLDGQRLIPKRLTDLGFQFRFADPEVALKDLLASRSRG